MFRAMYACFFAFDFALFIAAAIHLADAFDILVISLWTKEGFGFRMNVAGSFAILLSCGLICMTFLTAFCSDRLGELACTYSTVLKFDVYCTEPQ